MITAIAIDDEPLAISVITTFCQKIDYINLTRTFTETGPALKYLHDNPVDLLFLDINMPAISGIDFYKQVPKSTMAIFTTAYSEFAVECFDLSAIDYILKPFEFARFQKAVEKAKEFQAFFAQKDNTASQYLFVKADYSLVKVAFSDILYIEGLDNYIKIHFENNKSLLVRMSMKGVSEKLPAHDFVRVHRSFIIKLQKVKWVRNKTIHLEKDVEIPIGTNYVEDVLKLFKETH